MISSPPRSRLLPTTRKKGLDENYRLEEKDDFTSLFSSTQMSSSIDEDEEDSELSGKYFFFSCKKCYRGLEYHIKGIINNNLFTALSSNFFPNPYRAVFESNFEVKFLKNYSAEFENKIKF